MIRIQINERMFYKITSLIPPSIITEEDDNAILKEFNVEVENISIFNNEYIDLELNVELIKIKLYIKLFKFEIPVFKLGKTKGIIILKLLLTFDKKNSNLIITPIIKKTKLKKIPAPITFIIKTIFNIFYKNKSKLHLKIEPISLEGLISNRHIIIDDIKMIDKNFELIGHLDNHSDDDKVIPFTSSSALNLHKNKDIIVCINTNFFKEMLFDVIPKFYSTGVPALPDVEFISSELQLFKNDKLQLILKGHLLDIKKNPFSVSITGAFSYIRNKQHIKISNINIKKVNIDNIAYQSLKKIIELFIKAYLQIPISLPNPEPLIIPIEELGISIKIMFSNPSYNIDKDLFIASLDTYI